MRQLRQDEIEILQRHAKWLRNEKGGQRADLRDAYLRGAYLRGADLRDAYLRGADLRGAYLRDANLRGANLRGANLQDADLRGANLQDADLRGANLRGANLAQYKICPEGEIIGWKKCRDNRIVKLLIPTTARRVNAIGSRKCRAEFAKVLDILQISKGVWRSVNEAIGLHDSSFVYRVGEMALPKGFDPSITVECGEGIHFFITRAEAEEW